MTDAAERMAVARKAWRQGVDLASYAPDEPTLSEAQLDALLSLAPEGFPRRVVLEQESEGAPVVVRLLDRWPAAFVDSLLFRLSDVPEEAPDARS